MGFKSLCLNRSGAIRAKIFLMFLEKMPDMAEKLPNIKIRIYQWNFSHFLAKNVCNRSRITITLVRPENRQVFLEAACGFR